MKDLVVQVNKKFVTNGKWKFYCEDCLYYEGVCDCRRSEYYMKRMEKKAHCGEWKRNWNQKS